MNKIRVNKDVVYCEKINRDVTLIHISDIHFNRYTKDKKLDNIKLSYNKDDIIVIGHDCYYEHTLNNW